MSLLLKKHDLTMDRARELLETEVDLVGGGLCNDTVFITPNGDGRDPCSMCDGEDCGKK